MKVVTHDKTDNVYIVLEEITNSTNDRDGEVMILYQNLEGEKFVRNKEEFYRKFTIIDTNNILYVYKGAIII